VLSVRRAPSVAEEKQFSALAHALLEYRQNEAEVAPHGARRSVYDTLVLLEFVLEDRVDLSFLSRTLFVCV
jgi:hypothetical protein